MSLQNMNQMRLVPMKDYVANRLVSGALQLARNTLLFLDETQLEQGQLDTTGEACRNHKMVNRAFDAPPAFACHRHDPTELVTRWRLPLCVSVA